MFGDKGEVRMRLKAALLVTLVLALPVAGACGLLGVGGKVFVDLMKKVPGDSSSFSYWAIDKIDGDQDLWDLYDVFGDSPEAEQIKSTGLVLSIVEHVATASGFSSVANQSARLLKGEFNLDDMEDRLDRQGYQKTTTYQETGIWTPPADLPYQPLALKSDMVIVGDESSLKACIDTGLKDQDLSLYENPNIKLVAERLPDGILVYLEKATTGSKEQYPEIVAYGKSYRKGSPGMLELTAVYMFQSSSKAGAALGDIASYLETQGFSDVKTERQENFARATGRIYVTDFVEGLTF